MSIEGTTVKKNSLFSTAAENPCYSEMTSQSRFVEKLWTVCGVFDEAGKRF